MQLTRVQSSHIWEIGHEGDTLYIRYWPSIEHPEGKLVRYLGVDAKTAEAVMNSPSVGGAMHTMIRGKYEHQ